MNSFLTFSPNSSKNHHPLAESTAIGSPLVRQVTGNPKRKSISPPLSNPIKQRSVKIDPHVLTDAQSSGIVSRLVKYYDQSTNDMDRSRIVYNKFGDYPLVQLKKTEIKRPISRSTSVRIAPPNKSVMNPSLRAAIMRSNSFHLNSGIPKIMPTKMRAKDDLHQIITNHDPITDITYSASSKSVLDALEKNCRKRINNEELILDRNKKFCAPEVVDSREREPNPVIVVQSSKRNREQISPTRNSNDINTQQPLKKIRIKNNALLSSLSSSHFDLLPSQKIPKVPSVPPSPVASVKSKAAVVDDTMIIDVPEQVNLKTLEAAVDALAEKQKVNEAPQQKRLHLFNRKPDANAMLNRAKLRSLEDDDDEIKIRFVKPKEKILENYDIITHVEQQKLARMLDGLSKGFKSPTKEAEDKDTVDTGKKESASITQPAAAISFSTITTSATVSPISTPASTASSVIPQIKLTEFKEAKTSDSTSTSTTLSISNTFAKSQLPKGISGCALIGTEETDKNKSISAIVSTTTSSSSSDVLTTTSAALNFTKPVSPLALFSTPTLKTSSLSDAPAVDPNKSLISFTPIATKPSTESVEKTAAAAATTISSALPTFGSTLSGGFKFGSSNEAPKISSGGGFNFGANKDSSTSSSPKFGSNQPVLPKLPTTISTQASILNFQTPAVTTTTASAPNTGFSFGSNSSPGIMSSAATPVPVLPFGSSGGISSNTTPQLSSSTSFTKPETTVASGIGFSFGNTNKPLMTFGNSSNNQVATTTSSFSFGQSPTAAPSQSSPSAVFPSTTPATSAPSTFSFGSSNTVNSGFSGFGAAAASQKPAEAQPSAAPSSGMFSFGQKPQTTPATTNANIGFSFGASTTNNNQPSNVLSPQQSSNAFNFGQTANNESNNQKSGGIFSRLGDKQTETKAAPFSFGTNAAANSNNSSPFGSQANNAAPTPVFGQTSSPSSSASMFGQSSTVGNNNNSNNLFSQSNQNSTSMFGGNSTVQQQQQQSSQPQGGIFSFGNGGSQTSNNNNNRNANNNSQQASSGMFNFGSNNNNNNNNSAGQTSSNIFGSNNPGQNVSASFTFNAATGAISNGQSQNQNPFGQSSSVSANSSSAAAPPPYQFGGSLGNNQSASFTFSGPASAPTPHTNNPAFNFGGAASATPSVSSNAFNFQGQSQNQQPQQQQQSPGLFNIGTGGNQQQRRPIRAATRRFK